MVPALCLHHCQTSAPHVGTASQCPSSIFESTLEVRPLPSTHEATPTVLGVFRYAIENFCPRRLSVFEKVEVVRGNRQMPGGPPQPRPQWQVQSQQKHRFCVRGEGRRHLSSLETSR